MSLLKWLFGDRESTHETAAKQLLAFNHACLAFGGDVSESEKHRLSRLLFLLGAVDCASQAYKMSEKDFALLAKLVFDTLDTPPPYVEVLFDAFVHLDAVPVVRDHVIEGGRCFSQWLNGNSMVAFPGHSQIQRAAGNPAFPASPGHLYVLLHPQ